MSSFKKFPSRSLAHLVDQVAGGGRLAGVDVTDDDNVDMSLFLTHVESSKT